MEQAEQINIPNSYNTIYTATNRQNDCVEKDRLLVFIFCISTLYVKNKEQSYCIVVTEAIS